MDYRWTVKDLRKRQRELEKLTRTTTDAKKELLWELKVLSLDIDNLTNQDKTYLTLPYIERLEILYDVFLPNEFTWDACINFDELTKGVGYIPSESKVNISKEDIFSITHDFYRDAIGGELYKVFLKHFNNRGNHVRFVSNNKNTQGQTMYIKHFCEAFIEAQYEHLLSDILILIHEYGHVLHYSKNYYQQQSTDFIPYQELISSSMELIANDYLISQGIFREEAIKTKASNWSYFTNLVRDFHDLFNILNIDDFDDAKHLKSIAMKKFNLSSLDFDSLMSTSQISNFPYVYGNIIAIELLDLYHQDRDLALSAIMQILNDPADDALELNDTILELGIIPNKHVTNYEKQIKRELKLIQ